MTRRPAPAPACPVPSRPRRRAAKSFARRYLALCPCRRPAQRTTLARLADGRQGLPLQRWPQYLGRRCRRPRAQRHHGGRRRRPDLDQRLCLSALPGPSGGAAADQRRAHLRSNTGNSETLAAIGPREAFHRHAQEDWPGLRKPGGYRGDLATLDPRPAEYRLPCSSRCSRPCARPGSATAT
ncbi:hypothetical protein P4234_18145 [Pseudomonas aeruginosa]|nr:hypothetical protein [Pseudomonas aeruginosa]